MLNLILKDQPCIIKIGAADHTAEYSIIMDGCQLAHLKHVQYEAGNR